MNIMNVWKELFYNYFLRDLILNNHDRLYLDIYYAIFGLCLFCQYVQTETCTQFKI